MRTPLAVLCLVLVATSALAVAPGKDAYLVSVGHAQGSCVGSPAVCAQWRTAMWIFNPSTTTTANVTMYFLERNKANPTPVQQSITVAPLETKEYLDAVLDPLGVDGKYGGIRVTSDIDVVVTGRIYDANVPSTKGGIGTTGQFFAGLPPSMAIGNGESSDLIGLAQDAATSTGVWRTNFGFQEVTGESATVQVQRLDGNGNVLATKTYTIEGRAQRQYAITDVGGAFGLNHRLRFTGSGGNGKVLVFGSRIDNKSGDPSTVEMTAVAAAAAPSTGLFDGIVFTSDGLLIDGGIETVITSSGLTGFAGIAGLPCGTDSYIVDFSATAASPIPLAADGSFTAEATIPYSDGSSTVFTTAWTLAGTLGADGAIHGTLTSTTTGGAGDWLACNATVVRDWRAGWTQNP
jgi:ACT domain-containing protein